MHKIKWLITLSLFDKNEIELEEIKFYSTSR